MPEQMIPVAGIPAPGGKLTPAQWRDVEKKLEEWKAEVLEAVRQHPARSFEAGRAQVEAFVNLLGKLGQVSIPPATVPVAGPTSREAQWWVERYTFHEIDDALNEYIGKIKNAILYGTRGAMNPTTIAAALYKATKDSQVNWRAIARTEAVRANAAGRYRAMEQMGYDRCWIPPHAGACGACRRLLENKVFPIGQLKDATNYGRKAPDWIPAIPLHPHCRHVPLPYEPEVYDAAVEHYRKMEEAGFTDDERLDQMFDSSGQLNPEYASTDFSMFKTRDELHEHVDQLYQGALADAVSKCRTSILIGKVVKRHPELPLAELRTDLYQRAPDPDKVEEFADRYRNGADRSPGPPIVSAREDGSYYVIDGQHRVAGAIAAGRTTLPCDVRRGLTFEDESRICREAMGEDYPRPDVAKGFFDNPQAGLDPLLWDEGDRLRGDVYGRLVQWATHVLGPKFGRWAGLYLSGGATSPQWLAHPERDSDVDLQVVVNYGKLRADRREWAEFADADLHYALTALVKAGLENADDIMPGLRLDAFLRPEQTMAEFERDAQGSRQNVWSVLGHRWIVRNASSVDAELYGDPWLEGIGAELSDTHPDWVVDARAVTDELERGLRDYMDDPSAKHLRQLREAYRIVHDMRQASYVPVGEAVDNMLGTAPVAAELAHGYEGRGNFIWQYAVNFGPLMQIKHLLHDVGKIWPLYTWRSRDDASPGSGDGRQVAKLAARAPDTGTEHWITVHPHGPDEPGQPVLVRNNSDGSMTVIGGAGGSLNYLRLDKGRRIDDKKGRERGESAAEQAKLTADQPVSEEERQQQEREFQQRQKAARALVERVEEKKSGVRQELLDYLKAIDYNVEEKRIVHTGTGAEEVVAASKTEQRKAIQRLQQAALHTLAYGEISRKDANESPWLIEEKHGDFEGMPDDEKPDGEPEIHKPDEQPEGAGPDDESPAADEELDQVRQRMPSLPPLSKEQAQAIMEMQRKIARYGRQQSKARKVLRQGGEVSDSLALDWRDADVKDDVHKRVTQEVRTDVARDLLETAESKRNPGKVRYQRALRDGAYDSVDGFTNAVLGVSAIGPEVGRLLGPAGTAQLAAHAIRQYGEREGVELDMQKALDALEEHTQRQEQQVGTTALARARSAADTAVQMREERKLSEAGQSLWLKTTTHSYEQEKMGEAARLLGMAIGGMEATSALKVALTSPSEKIKVGGFESSASIKALAQKAGLQVGDGDITRVGAGNYTLSLNADRMDHLLRFDKPPNTALRDRLRKLRTPGQLDAEVAKAQRTPDMADTLDPMQARGKLVLTSTAKAGGGCVLAFAPGRGKTHTALAAALDRMHEDGVPHGKGNTWIVCPTTAMAEWAGTIAKNTTRSCQMVGNEFEHLGGGVIQSKRKTSRNHVDSQLGNPADFNIVSLEHLQTLLKRNPELADQVKAARVITDESQKTKNDKADRWRSLGEFAKHTHERWALSGTTVEKKLRDFGSQYKWANPDKALSPAAMEEKHGKLGQTPHVLGEDKVRQFREGIDEGLYALGADDANLPSSTPQPHDVELDPEHKAALQKLAENINHVRDEAKERGLQGISGIEADRMMRQALYERPGNAMAKSLADEIDKSEAFDFDDAEGGGKNAGTFEPKHIVFSQFVKQLNHVVDELQGGDHKVFFAHGGMSNEENDKVLKQFLAHKGRAVLVSSDKNSTARSLQFGYNKGKFQHGATHLHHYSQPDNNAVIQQRNARQHRKGSAAPVTVHTYNAGTPAEIRQQNRLANERRTQQLVGNSEQLVGGRESLRRRLERRGQKPAAMQAAEA